MVHQIEIDQAIEAHEAWKQRLHEAISTHTIDLPLDKIARDDCCDFGRWLNSNLLTEDEKRSQRYKLVKYLHADFHKVAGQVASFAVNGDESVALKMMSEVGRYTITSKRLLAAMHDWRKISRSIESHRTTHQP